MSELGIAADSFLTPDEADSASATYVTRSLFTTLLELKTGAPKSVDDEGRPPPNFLAPFNHSIRH
jgi:hypothetical protein